MAIPFIFLLVFSQLAHIAVGTLVTDLLVSFGRLLVAYIIAAILGWICAVAFYRGQRAAVALPLFDVLQSFPTFALLPLAITTFGPSNLTIMFFLVVTIIWPVFFSLISSLKLMRKDWQEAAAIYGVSGWLYLRKFLIPVSLPGLITGSIVGLGEGWEALVATEVIIGLHRGLGSFFQTYSHNVTITIFGIVGFLLVIFSINKVIWLSLLDWSHHRMEE